MAGSSAGLHVELSVRLGQTLDRVYDKCNAGVNAEVHVGQGQIQGLV